MDKNNFGQLVSFIFGIANDCLVDVYDVGDYRKIILPMIVIRRFDAILEPTKQDVLKMKKQLDENNIVSQDAAMPQEISRFPIHLITHSATSNPVQINSSSSKILSHILTALHRMFRIL